MKFSNLVCYPKDLHNPKTKVTQQPKPTSSLIILRPPSRSLISPLPTPPTPLLPRSYPLSSPTTSNSRTSSHFFISRPISSPVPIVRPSSRASRPHHPNIHRKKEDRDTGKDDADYRGRGKMVITAVVVEVIWAAPAGKNVKVHISPTRDVGEGEVFFAFANPDCVLVRA
ncbi:hypothetical protein N431DRAFT_439639 [Stipitochalara longipes BDJ]|nr:hypothetical protein N431DRAFT_439639 [Stipitochalara longipes BDJ]